MNEHKYKNDEDDDEDEAPTMKMAGHSKSSLSDNGIKYLCANIDGYACKPIIEWILEENFKKRFKRLTLIITSYGGQVYPSFGLIDVMMGSAIPVDTVGLGYIASAGLTIFIHGKRRVLTPNTYILAHQYSGAHYGKEHELVASRKEEDWLSEKFIDMYTKNSKLSVEQVKNILLKPSDTFLTAKEALKYGLTDEIRVK